MANVSTLTVLLTLLIGILCSGGYSLDCRYNQFKVQDVMGNLSCIDCKKCLPGYGLSPPCYSFVKYGTPIQCKKCEPGKTFSDAYDISSCSPCGICSQHENVKRNCTLTSNSKCDGDCSKEFYYEELTGNCRPCSFCCSFLPNSDESNSVKDGCKDMPFYQQCDANVISCQAPKCRDDQYLVVTRKKASAHCVDCKSCPAGTSLSPRCGSIVESTDDVKCKKCSPGETFSDKPGKQPCKVCSTCSVGQKELIPCNLTHDRVCGKCDEGFYTLNGTECKPCSACCNDDQDVQISECVKQNLPRNKICSYSQRSITVCQEKHSDRTIDQEKYSVSTTLLILMTVGIIICILAMVLTRYLKHLKNKGLQRSQSYAALLKCAEEAPQSPFENPTAHGAQETLSFDKSGVIVQFGDANSFFNEAQGITLEICWDVNLTLQHGEVQLSPIIKFHPYGVKLSKPAKVRIPHSALVFYSNGWNIKLKSSTLHKDSTVWKYEELYEVHNNEVSFEVDSLSSFVVIGTSLDNNKPTKKRLQSAVFGGEGTVGEDYIAYLYVFDDCEASLEKIMQEERLCGRILLGSPQSLYVETVIKTDIKISVKQPVEGWIVGEIKPEFIGNKSIKESYQTIPRATILFNHDDGRNRDFLCVFELTSENTSTTICAVASIKEDPFRSHQLVTGRNLCDPVILSQEQPSPCLHKLPKEVFHDVCMKLDKRLEGAGNWQNVGKSLGFTKEQIELFRNEMLVPDGSPCTVMLEALMVKSPQLTVAEFVQILQTRSIQRFDVVNVLEPYLFDPIPNGSNL